MKRVSIKIMQHTLTGGLFFAMLVGSGVGAAEQHNHGMDHEAMKAMPHDAGLQHGDIVKGASKNSKS